MEDTEIMIKNYYLLFLQLLFSLTLLAQPKPIEAGKKYIQKLVNDTSESARPQFVIYPTLAYSPETSWELGTSGLYVFYAKNDTTNRLSEISGFAFYTFENQYGMWLDNALYSDQEEWFLLGKMRFQSYPLLYHGIGPNSSERPLAQVNAFSTQIRQRLLYQLFHNLYLGPELDFQQLSSVTFTPVGVGLSELPEGSRGSANLGMGMGLVFDNRDNVLNVRKGAYSELAFLHANQTLGSDFSFTTLMLDNRWYKPLGRNNVLAAQAVSIVTSGNVPFNQLALLGGETIMRGYYYGRYRDKNSLAAQVEYRMLPLPFRFTKRLGLATFISTGTVYNRLDNLYLKNFLVAGGGGIRYLLFPKKDVFVRADAAFTNEGPGFYIYIGEAF